MKYEYSACQAKTRTVVVVGNDALVLHTAGQCRIARKLLHAEDNDGVQIGGCDLGEWEDVAWIGPRSHTQIIP